jgi:hypothetical protein
MKKILSILGICAFLGISNAQEKATDMFSINAGVLGAELGYEKRLSEDFTLSGKIGYEMIITGDDTESWFKMPAFVITPTIGIEGRYYLNFDKRIEKGLNTLNNSADFIALEVLGAPFKTAKLGDSDNKYVSLNFIPKYGLRRSLSENFFLEWELGPNFSLFSNELEWDRNSNGEITPTYRGFELTVHAALRIGYRF